VVEVELPPGRGAATPAGAALLRHEGDLPSCRPPRRQGQPSTPPGPHRQPGRRQRHGGRHQAGERVAVKGVSGLKAMLTGVGKE
jgi:hypothetical protein